MKSPCWPSECLDRCVRFWVKLLLTRWSHTSRRSDRISDLLAYEQERIDCSLAVSLSEQFEARSGSPFYFGQNHSCSLPCEQRFMTFFLFWRCLSHSYLSSLKESVYSSVFPTVNLHHMGKCPVKVKNYIIRNNSRSNSVQVDSLIGGDPSGSSFYNGV